MASEIEAKLVEAFHKDTQKRDRVHLSDCCNCEVKAYNRFIGMQPVFNQRIIGIMMIGIVGQEILQRCYPEEMWEYEPDQALDYDMQFPAHIDIFLNFEYPLEIKWTRKNIYRASDIQDTWISQLSGYLARTHKNVGYLVIVNVITGRIVTFKMIMTDEELAKRNDELLESRARILLAFGKRDPTLLKRNGGQCGGCFYKPGKARRTAGYDDECELYLTKKQAEKEAMEAN